MPLTGAQFSVADSLIEGCIFLKQTSALKNASGNDAFGFGCGTGWQHIGELTKNLAGWNFGRLPQNPFPVAIRGNGQLKT